MKIIRTGALILFAAGLTMAAFSSALLSRRSADSGKGQHPLSVSPFDFGTEVEGSTVSHIFKLTNDNDNEIQVLEVKSSCSCTLAQSPPKSLAAHAATDFAVTAHVVGINEDFRTFLAISLSNGQKLTLVMQGHVLKLNPEMLDFGEIRKDSPPSKTFIVKAFDASEPGLTDVVYDKDRLIVAVSPVPDRPTDTLVEVRLAPTQVLQEGPFELPLEFHVGSRTAKSSVRVVGYVLRSVELEKELVSFGMMNRASIQSQNVILTAPYGGPIHVRKISGYPEHAIQVNISNEDTEKVTLEVRVDSSAFHGLLRADIDITAIVNKMEIVRRLTVYAMSQE